MKKEVNSSNDTAIKHGVYKLELIAIKTIPSIIALLFALNSLLSYYSIDIPLLSYLGGVSLLPLVFLYLSSYTFGFCTYHRIILHYITVNWVLNIIDYYYGIPFEDRGMFVLYMSLFGTSLIGLLYIKFIR